jgi:hypothetical protein
MQALTKLPPGVEEALDLASRFDECLVHGFARLGEDHRRSLESLAAGFAGSPLGSTVADAVEAVGRSEFVARSFLALASARVALLGAVHDALLAQARAALGRPAAAIEERPPLPPGGASSVLASAQHWLAELAIAGFRQLEETAVAPFAATLEKLQDLPELTGLAALLTGFLGELVLSVPTSRLPAIPAFRWGDLWSSAFVRTQQLPAPVGFRDAAGTLTPLGLDVHAHENFAAAVLYGLLDEGDGDVRTVRVPFNGYKVGAIAGAELWDLFGPQSLPVLEALQEQKALKVAQAELREDGDLILRAPPKPGRSVDPFSLADRLGPLPPPPAPARHPVHIAEVVHLPAGHGLPLAIEHLPPKSDLTAAPAELIGLLRFDRGGWRVQPLCVRHPILGVVRGGEELAEARKKLKHHSLNVLKERASRLLRKS